MPLFTRQRNWTVSTDSINFRTSSDKRCHQENKQECQRSPKTISHLLPTNVRFCVKHNGFRPNYLLIGANARRGAGDFHRLPFECFLKLYYQYIILQCSISFMKYNDSAWCEHFQNLHLHWGLSSNSYSPFFNQWIRPNVGQKKKMSKKLKARGEEVPHHILKGLYFCQIS